MRAGLRPGSAYLVRMRVVDVSRLYLDEERMGLFCLDCLFHDLGVRLSHLIRCGLRLQRQA